MSGDCPECDRPLLWGGMGWEEHTDAQHATDRRRLMSRTCELLHREMELRRWQLDLLVADKVGIHWRNGVYRSPATEIWSEVPREVWRHAEAHPEWMAFFLRSTRISLTEMLRLKHNVVVNPATWFHKIYDGRTP